MVGKTVCIVGAGTSGIASIKECVKQGLEPTCFELDSELGGVWQRKDPTKPMNTANVWNKLVSNTSKFVMCFSDFPPHPDETTYISSKHLQEYLLNAVDHFNLRKYVKFNTRVMRIRKSPDYDSTGRWEVFTCSSNDPIAGNASAGPRGGDEVLAKCQKHVFDCVMVGIGYYKVPRYPSVPGMDSFKGKISHSFTYNGGLPYEGKKVLIVGNKFSAADICNDVANFADETYIAFGDGTWILPRCFPGGKAIDQIFSRSMIWSRDADLLANKLYMDAANTGIDHYSSGIGPNRPPSSGMICISDELPGKIVSGVVKPYGKLKALRGRQAVFEEGHVIEDLDDVIFCTGYSTDTSFLDFPLHDETGKMELFLMTFPLRQKHDTLAIIGHYGTDGPMISMCENHARLAAMVMSGRHKLPSQDAMQRDADMWNKFSFDRKRHYRTYCVPGLLIMDALAVECGFYPSFWKVFFRDPVLAFRNWFGPMFAAQYRLVGPDSQWDEAKAICYQLYDEGLASIRHMVPKNVDRPDLRHRRNRRILTLAVVAGISSAILYWKRDCVSDFLASLRL